jgi:uncharacterized membrane protein YeiH
MELFAFVLELVGAAAFAVSGAMTGWKKRMDIFGVCIMGLTTACGGGVLRDLMLGKVPPSMFREPVYALTALLTSVLLFALAMRPAAFKKARQLELLLLWADALGLGIFTAVGVEAVFAAGYGANVFFAVFLGVLTGVGGGLLRDVLAGDRPYIFVRHIYACASIFGALLCALLRDLAGQRGAMLLCVFSVLALRLLASHYRWSLPRARGTGGETRK